jgi:ABC-type multidrug transport system fused ATPase/permease subunit
MATESVEDIKTQINQELSNLENLDDAEIKRKNQEVKEMIQYYNRLTDDIEDRRNKILTFTTQYLVILLTASGITISKQKELGELFWFIIVFFCIQIVSSVIILIYYVFQSYYRYPFLKLKEYTNKWKWFYYGNEHILKLDRNVFKESRDINKTSIPYLAGLKLFVSNFAKENEKDEIKDNIMQLYLLQVHNYYKNRFYLVLVNIQKWSFIWTAILLGLLGLIFLLRYCICYWCN